MILTMVGSALAAAAVPTASAPGTASSSRPAPVVVLGTDNLTWTDIQAQASRHRAGDHADSDRVDSSAAHLLSFASANEPMNLSVRTPADRTCSADGWLTLGRGTRASALKPADSCAGPTTAVPDDTPWYGRSGMTSRSRPSAPRPSSPREHRGARRAHPSPRHPPCPRPCPPAPTSPSSTPLGTPPPTPTGSPPWTMPCARPRSMRPPAPVSSSPPWPTTRTPAPR